MSDKVLKTSAAQRRAQMKWNAKHAQLLVRVKPEIKEQFDAHRKARGESLASFIVRSGLNQIERDKREELEAARKAQQDEQ